MANVAGVDASTATTGLTAVMKGYGLDVSETEHVTDVLIKVGQEYAISAEELMESFEKGGAALHASGASLEESAALFAASNAALQNASTTGTLWKTLSARLRGSVTDLAAMGEETEGLANGLSKYREEFKALSGVDIMWDENTYKNPYEIFVELAKVWDQIESDTSKSRLAEILGGTRNLSGVMSTITNIKDAMGAYEGAMNSAGTAMEANEKHMETTEAHLGQLRASFQELSTDVFNSDFLKGAVDTIKSIVEAIDTLAKSVGTLGTVAIGGGLAKFILSLFQVKKSTGAFNLITALGKTIPGLAAGMESFTAALAGGSGAFAALTAGASGFLAVAWPLLAVLAAIGVAFAGFKHFDKVNTEWTRANEKAKEATDSYKEAKDELESYQQQQQEGFDKAAEIAGKYNIDVSGLDTVDEVIAKINASDKGITLVDEAELSKISAANDKLESQITLQEQLVKARQEANIAATSAATGVEKSFWEMSKEKRGGGILGNIGAVWDVLKAHATTTEVSPGVRKTLLDAYEDQDTTTYGLAQKALEDYMATKDKLAKVSADENSDVEERKKRYDELTQTLAEQGSELSNYMNSLSETVDILSESDSPYDQTIVKQYKDLIEQFTDIDLTDAEKALNHLNNFFDGSAGKNTIKDRLTEAAKNGEDLEVVLNQIGLTLDDLGADKSSLEQYFAKAKTGADKAAEAVRSYRKTVSDVEEATSSANQDKDWTTIQGAIKQAQEDLKAGKTGTDDFQTVAQFLSPKNLQKLAEDAKKKGTYVADVYQEAFEKAQKKAERYFGEDEGESLFENFASDLEKKGFFKIDKNDEKGLWDIQLQKKFKNTAAAADELGISVEAVETLLQAMETYGYDFSGIEKSGDMLNEYETTLNNLKGVYESMDEGPAKEALKATIEQYENELKTFDEDLEKLTKPRVIQIKLDYDVAQARKEVDELNQLINAGGGTVENRAERIVAKENLIEKSMKEAGLDKKGVELPVQFTVAKGKVDELMGELENTDDESRKIELQAEINNYQDMQQQVIDQFANAHPKITPETDVKEINEALASQKFSINVGFNFNKSGSKEAEEETSELEDKTVNLVANVEGTDKINEMTGAINNVPIEKNPSIVASVSGKSLVDGLVSSINSLRNRDIYITTHYSSTGDKSGAGGLHGTAHASGTAWLEGLNKSYLDYPIDTGFYPQSWQTSRTQTALTGEVGQEMVVNGNRWWLVGQNGAEFSHIPAHSVVFNARQTDELLTNGAIDSRGSFLGGTAFRYGTKEKETKTTTSKPKSRSTRKRRSSSSSSSDKNKDKSKVKDISKYVEKLFDWIEVALERVSDKIDTYVSRAKWAKEDKNYSASTSNYKKAISYSASELRKEQKAQTKYTKQADKILDKAGLKKAKKKTIKKLDANGKLKISSYDKKMQTILKEFQSWMDKARKAKQDSEEIKRSIQEYVEEIYDNIKSAFDDLDDKTNKIMELNKARSNNATSTSAKNDYLKKVASGYDEIVANDNKEIAQYDSAMNSNASTISKYKVGTKKYKNAKKATKKKVDQVIAKAKNEAKGGNKISDSTMKDVADYYAKGYIGEKFYLACVNYNEAIERKNEATVQRDLDVETAKAEKASIGQEMFSNVKEDYSNQERSNSTARSLTEARQATRTTRGQALTANDYQDLIDSSKREKDILTREQAALRQIVQENLVSGYWTTGSQEYLDAINDIEDLSTKIQECVTQQEEYNNAIAQLPLDRIQKQLEILDAIASLIEAQQNIKTTKGYLLDEADYTASITENLKQMAEYEKLRADYLAYAENASKSSDGYWGGKSADEWNAEANKTAATIANLAASNEELKNSIVNIPFEKLEKQLEYLESAADYYDSLRELRKSRGEEWSEMDYLDRIADVTQKIALYEQQREIAYSNYLAAMAAGENIGGKSAEEWLSDYYEFSTTINESKSTIEEIKDDLRDDVYWRTFEKAHDSAKRLLDVVQGIADLTSDDMYFDKDGNLTKYGIAQVANLVKQYELARTEVQNYTNDIKNLNELYAQGQYTMDEYNEKLAELQSGVLDAANTMKTQIEAIKDMYKEMAQSELDALIELVEKREEALQKKQNYYSYGKSMRDHEQEINDLQAEIAALQGVEGAAAKAKKAKLEESLAKAQEELEDMQMDHYFELSQDALSELKETLQEQFDDKWERLGQDLKSMAQLLSDANTLAKDNASNISATLNEILNFYGINKNTTGIGASYASGTRRVGRSLIGLSNESGSELIITPNGIISHFNPGDGVVPSDLTERLYTLAEAVRPNSSIGSSNLKGVKYGAAGDVNQYYDSLIHIDGSADAATVEDLKRMSQDLLDKSYKYTSQRIHDGYLKAGGRRRI